MVVVKKLVAKTASNGNPFLSLEFGDRGGSFGCTLFNDNPLFEALKSAGEGSIIRIKGRADFFQNRLSPRLHKAVLLSNDQLGAPGVLDNLVELAPEKADGLWTELQAGIGGHPARRAPPVDPRGL